MRTGSTLEEDLAGLAVAEKLCGGLLQPLRHPLYARSTHLGVCRRLLRGPRRERRLLRHGFNCASPSPLGLGGANTGLWGASQPPNAVTVQRVARATFGAGPRPLGPGGATPSVWRATASAARGPTARAPSAIAPGLGVQSSFMVTATI
jgi:hypothetical protein